MKKSIILSLLLMSVITLHAQRADYSVVPMPQQIHLTGKSMFRLSASTRIVYPEADEEMERNARFLQDYVREITGIRPVLSTNVLQSTVGFEALMKILKDILSIDNNIKFKKDAFDKYVNKFADLQLHDTNQFPMTTRGKKILYYSIFIKVFPDDASIEEKKIELESLHNAD